MNLTDPQIIAAIGAIGGLLAIILGILKLAASWRSLKKRWNTRIGNFFDDWEGRPARPGKDAEPGVMERLKVLETTQSDQKQTLKDQDGVLETIRHEVEFNNGSSVKDAVSRIENRLDEHLKPSITINASSGGSS